MPQKADVVVLGAGVAGCAVAYYLAKEGLSVTVVERDAIGSCASGYALGLLNPLTGTGIPGPIQEVTEAAFQMHLELWPLLKRDSGIDFQERLMPSLDLCLDAEQIEDKRSEARRWDQVEGFSARWLSRSEVLELEPRVSSEVQGGVLLDNVGMVDSYRYTLALARAAERHGALFVDGEATGIKSAGQRVTAVVLGQGEIACHNLVVALGPWSKQVSAWLKLNVPVEPLMGQILYLEGMEPRLEYHIHGSCSVVHKADGKVWVGATQESTGFDVSTSTEARDLLMRHAVKMVPALAELRVLRQTACLRPVSPDLKPILGEAPGWEGVYIATAAEKQGILISPVFGRAVADLIVKGQTSLPIESFAPDRFAP